MTPNQASKQVIIYLLKQSIREIPITVYRLYPELSFRGRSDAVNRAVSHIQRVIRFLGGEHEVVQ